MMKGVYTPPRGALALAAWVVVSGAVACSDPPLPELMAVPDFVLVDQDAERFGSEQLRGKVWVANFIFTHCPSVCPTLTTQMGNLQRRIDSNDVAWVSFSVDPERDTPEVLTTYARRHRADWTFLTGETATVRRAIVDGLRVSMGEPRADGDISHATHFVLVDQRGRIRGYYRQDVDGQRSLERDIRRLLRAG